MGQQMEGFGVTIAHPSRGQSTRKGRRVGQRERSVVGKVRCQRVDGQKAHLTQGGGQRGSQCSGDAVTLGVQDTRSLAAVGNGGPK